VPAADREALAPIAEQIDDPLRATTLRGISLADAPAATGDEAAARLDLTGAGLLARAERFVGLDLGGRERTRGAMTDLLQEEVSRRTGVDIDNEPEGPDAISLQPDPTRRWTPRDLRTVEETLGRLPAAHRAVIGDINRAQNQGPPRVAGHASGPGGIALFDGAFAGDGGRKMSEPDPLAARDSSSSWLEEVVTHEVGHQVGFANNERLLTGFTEAAGWKDGRPAAGAIPSDSRWHYGKTDRFEHFAEMYASAVNSPTRLYDEFRASPDRERRAAQRELGRLEREGADPDAVTQAKERAARSQRIASSRNAQWRFMRENVFGVNDAIVAQRAAALRTQGGAGDEVANAFSREARKVMTPHQLDALFRRYQASK